MTEYLYTTQEVSNILHISLTALYGLIQEGKLKAINISKGKARNHWRIRKSDLDEFLVQGGENSNG